MKFADAIVKAYTTKWSYINSFTVYLYFAPLVRQTIGWDEVEDNKNINLHIVSIDTPSYTNQQIEQFVGNKWLIHNGRDELYRFSITFKDHDQMKLYRKFYTAYHLQKGLYFDQIKMRVELLKDSDYLNEDDEGVKLLDLNNTMIEGVSQLQFNNNTETQIAEFTVQFKSAEAIIKLPPKTNTFDKGQH